MNYQNRLFTYLYNQRTDLINIFLLSLISIIIFKTVGGSPIIGIWEGNNIYNIFAAQYNSFNIFSISPRANIGDYGYGTIALSRFFLELFNFSINLESIRLISFLYGHLSVILFYIICKRYFNRNSALFCSALFMTNPVFHNYQYELSNLSVSFMFFLLLFERLQKIELTSIRYSSFTLIIPIVFILIHYGIMRISAAVYLSFFIIYIYFTTEKKDFLNYLIFFFITYFISCLILIFFNKDNFFLLNSIDILFPKGSENFFTDDITKNSVELLKVLSINIKIYIESFISLLSNEFVSKNVNLVKADFRYVLTNIYIFLIFLFGLILSIYSFFQNKNLKENKNIKLIILLIVCLVPSIFSSVNLDNSRYLSTLSTHRLFISLFPIYLFICLFINYLYVKINKKIYFIIITIFVLINLLFLIDAKREINLKINESIKLNSIDNLKKIYGIYLDKDNYEHLKLQAEYIKVAKIICKKEYSDNTIIKVNLNNFKSGIPNPRSLRNLKNFNYHNIFLSLHIHNLCEKNTSWINVYDNFSKKLEFNFTNNFYYFANLNYSLNEYDNNQLVFELKNYDKKFKNLIITTTNKEEKFIKNYFNKLSIDYLIENIK